MTKKIIKLLGNVFIIPVYFLSILIPKSKNIWVFGSWFGMRYSDNSRYVYEYVLEHEKDLRPIWLSHNKSVIKMLNNKSFEAYPINSVKGFWYTCRASAAIFSVNLSDINRLGSRKLLKVQLWHGIPLKKIVYDDNYDNIQKNKVVQILKEIKSLIFPFRDVIGKWDIVLSTSPLVSTIFKSAFRLDDNHIVVTGSPRADFLLSPFQMKPEIFKETTESKNKQFLRIAYFPTHRNDSEALIDFIYKVSVLENFLNKYNAIFYIKLHYYNLTHIDPSLIQNSNIIIIQEEDCPDINELLPFVDILITDYSSVYFDYLLFDRPIIFLPFDLNDYQAVNRELYGDYNELTPGPKCYTWEEVMIHLEHFIKGNDEYEKIRTEFKQKYHTYQDTNNSHRVVKVVKRYINGQ
ncbi:CDP-glycerol glycerophosphotransferase family protein [Paenibacillus taichungensis]|uniref:CDP-glycerol glycerophosphotransferase family protein n=1 Tax=Paenibacillus taichungensis TaxID=484184 RepID=UPI002DBA55AC|nr:CDP-glycerol glycerophosphotransferase family protein [Paenibacillus taichungensis]MEC0106172.1 CDP-glycerol glycerophosphotransferase family protein [Paenibacillus taichungensis]MEC0199407.1 CDP-glycerol glycerophosphotransferase family protein [Paenibacillus taichungensis]